MDILGLFLGNKDYITIVKEFIFKVFVHEAKKYHCEPKDLSIVIDCDETNNLQIMTYIKKDNAIIRIIPDKEVQDILTK
jgi:hypothetical protein